MLEKIINKTLDALEYDFYIDYIMEISKIYNISTSKSEIYVINYLYYNKKNLYNNYCIITNFWNKSVSNLIIKIKGDDLNNLYYFTKENNFMFHIQRRNKVIWCRYENFWEVLENQYKLKYNQIQCFIKFMLERDTEMRSLTPANYNPHIYYWLERNTEMRSLTPRKANSW